MSGARSLRGPGSFMSREIFKSLVFPRFLGIDWGYPREKEPTMAIRVAQSLVQRLSDDMVYDLVHPETGHFVRIRLGCNERLDDAVETIEFDEDRAGAEEVSYGTVSYTDRRRGEELAMGFAKMYAGQGFKLCTEPPYERRKK